MRTVFPGDSIGVLGGGQLGRMLALEARRMGYRVGVLDPVAGCPAAQVADFYLQAPLDDVEAALRLAARVDVVTLENEFVPSAVIAQLEVSVPVRPSSSVLRTIQDRLLQKEFLKAAGFPQAPFAAVDDPRRFYEVVREVDFPAVLKSRQGGYDGKGQVLVAEPGALENAWRAIGGRPAVLETFVPFKMEIAVILARGVQGEMRVYQVAENVHVRHILHTTRVPARVSERTRREAERLACGIAEILGHVGVMAVEMFVLGGESVLINEIAPRTHNSGHYTFGTCVTSQFEQHLRAVCGLPLGDPALLSPAVMVNLLGDLWLEGTPRWETVLSRGNARLHLYGKGEATVGRKMGHVLIVGTDTDRALQDAEEIVALLRPDATAFAPTDRAELTANHGSAVPGPAPALAGRTGGCAGRLGGAKFRFRKTGRTPRTPSRYNGCAAVLSTKHGKEVVVGPPLRAILGLAVQVPAGLDTDILGTFTGEVERVGSPLDIAIRKTRMGMDATGLSLGLASEGSFGPDPRAPFIPLHHELLVFVDDRLQTQVAEQSVTNRTNYDNTTAASLAELSDFLDRAGFPSHAVVVRPSAGPESGPLYKGLRTVEALQAALRDCASASPDGLAWVGTDMRAHMNPSRLAIIRRLAFRLGSRLLRVCPLCGTPGWGVVDVIKGLPCEECGHPTGLVSELVAACPRCAHRVNRARYDGRRAASAGDCPYCNP
ncbi:MAG: 5-(carboxyamino)imidazole ribonucleotide synthase [Eubacteriales bacterium]|nr:5-(carboxyamino)imidazole ribonucleotide synthase [Desulforudis sp.]MDQ7788905.1 5-(carboxyamino)imidazole ribonucleotide synthase [Clostridia bacterium]MDZ4042286.1 5-(carboxyamino)imidazole ribonucleotide synthase [Eubacteriales bacterium]MBV1736506.1 5-(carboxyamino)imidazole ribonucleotide synthase [Desulforudis sp.]MBV1769531.1 5-(carboxyamino)imidazole ribonucleotide synthase [Desulforudis sp.]